MTKRFRPWDPKQKWLLPPEITEFIPEGHPAHFVRDLVVEELDLAAILDTYVEDKGYPPFHPAMMVALLLYAYTQGVFSSRKIAKACIERMDFAAVTGFQKPDFRTISLFRKRHLTALGEDFRFRNRQGGELPAWVVNKAERMKKIREAKAALEQEAAAKAKEEENKPRKKAKKKDDDEDPPPPPTPEPKAQRNLTDPESRIMPTKNGFEQCYNAQAGVDARYQFVSRIPAGDTERAQVIVACEVVNPSADCPQLLAMVDQVHANLGRKPDVCSADAGYCSESNLAGMAARHIRAYIATGRQKHGSEAATHAKNGKPGSLIAAMRDKLRRGGWRSPYRLRKQVVEPVFGQIKQAMGFRQFLLRGLAKVKAELQLVCTAHNLLKLVRATC
jgi:transposase